VLNAAGSMFNIYLLIV